MLLDDNVVTDRQAKAGALSRRLSREERLEHLFFHVRRDADSVIADTDFHTIAKVFSRSRESRFVVVTAALRSSLIRSIEAVCNQIEKSTPDILRENVNPTSRRIKRLLKLNFETLSLGPSSMPCEIEAFLDKSVDINHSMLS